MHENENAENKNKQYITVLCMKFLELAQKTISWKQT